MATYALTVSTNALGLGVISGATVVVERKRTTVTDIYPTSSLYTKKAATNISGIATIQLEADDGSVFHEVKIFNTTGVLIYKNTIQMPPQAADIKDLPLNDIITESATQAVAASVTATTQAGIATEQAVLTAADRVQTGLDVIAAEAAADAAAADAASIIVATKKFSTYAEQMAYVGAYVDGQKADVLGYYAIGDGGFIQMYWSASSTAAHNGGTVRQPTAISGAGRWLAIESKKANVLQFGARGNNNADDYSFIQSALDAVGSFGVLTFPKTSTNIFLTSAELFFYEGQLIEGVGGTSVITNNGTQIKLTATASGVMSPINKSTTKYSGTFKSIYFNAQGFGEYGLSLYNCSYFNVEHCSANSSKANGCGVLLDSNVSLYCYFNIIRGGRFFATGTGGAAIRFTRGANANTVIGGKCGSSYCGMEFLQSSSGNIIIGADFEDNSYCHVYVDSPSNIFNSLHMESCPTGYLLTSNATNTSRIATSFASTVTTQVSDSSKTGSVLDTRIDTVSTKGDLRFGAAKFISNLLSSTTTLDYDPDLVSNTSNADIRLFLNTNTSGKKRILFYKGDGTTTLNLILSSTGEVTCNDLSQEAGVDAGLYRKICHRAAAPTTGTWSRGDKVFFTNPSVGGYIGAVCTVSGTPGTWNNFGLIV